MNKEQIAGVLRDYHWMIREIQRIRKELIEVESSGVAQYGIESTMPKAEGGVSDPISKEVFRREKKSNFQLKLERKVMYIQDRIHMINDDREQAVLHCILDGMSNIKIARHMGLSEGHIRNIKENIVQKLCENYEDCENYERVTASIDMA